MKNVLNETGRGEIAGRLARLEAGAGRRWGKMDAAQMCAHCASVLETATGSVPTTQKLIGVLLAPFVRGTLLRSETPMMRGAPTDPRFAVADPRDFAREKARLTAAFARFCDAGVSGLDGVVHPFFGRMTGDEWGILQYKHLDHHLRQFGV